MVLHRIEALKMLELRPNCEICDVDLAPNKEGAHICTFECTFCETCAIEKFNYDCPNCGDKLFMRPVRSDSNLKKYPASTKRVLAK